MSAIVGIYYFDGRPVDRQALERMVASVAHRGPDGTGTWNAGPVGFGHRMLWTTPESLQEHLPFVSKTGDLVLTADARIDNRNELITALDLADRLPGKISDGQLILGAYERWGERCPERLLGDFAFAIWDGRKQKLFCVRDPMGVKPFYYYRSGQLFAFASEIKALLCLPEVSRQLNEVRVADYLAAIFEDKVITLYQGVSRLPAACSTTVSREGSRPRSYWSPDLSREVRLHSDEEYARAFREIFTEAVRSRLRSAFPVGSLLSGGLDSSSVAGTAHRVLERDGGRPLPTFSAIFPSLLQVDQRIDENPYISAVLDMGNFISHYVYADRLSPLTEYDQVLWHADEAVPAPNLYMDWALFASAHQQGVRVLLSGFDGDSTVSHGYEHLAELTRTGKWKILVSEATALSRRFNSSVPLRKIIWHYGLRPLAPDPMVQIWRVLRRRTEPVSAVNTIINPAFAQRVGLVGRARALQNNGSVLTRTARKMHWLSLTSGLLLYALELLDKAAAASSLEVRYPFFDRRLIEFCLALPPEQKLHQGWTRWIQRRAMAETLPEQVRWRIRKGNLSSNFKLKLLEYERETLERVILKEPQVIEEYVDMPALRAAYYRYAFQPMQHEQDALSVFLAVTLALWLDRSGLAPRSMINQTI